jgi:hypothetical protein
MQFRHLVIAVTVSASLAYASGALALTNQPTVEAEGTAPRKATVTWDVPGEVEIDGKTVASWELGIAESVDFSDVDSFSYSADVLTANLTRSNGLRGMKQYYVRVRALYTDDTTSNYGSTFFYTQIGKLDQLRVDQTDLPVGSAKLKWKKPAREGNQLTYNVRLYRKGNVVYKGSVYGKNNLTVTNLKAGKKYKFKVRARQDSTYGIGKWSDLKAFRVNAE